MAKRTPKTEREYQSRGVSFPPGLIQKIEKRATSTNRNFSRYIVDLVLDDLASKESENV